jgi:hypothetical protein
MGCKCKIEAVSEVIVNVSWLLPLQNLMRNSVQLRKYDRITATGEVTNSRQGSGRNVSCRQE